MRLGNQIGGSGETTGVGWGCQGRVSVMGCARGELLYRSECQKTVPVYLVLKVSLGGSCSYTTALHTTGEGELLPLSPLSEREDVCNVKKVNLALLLVLIIIITIIISPNAWRT